MARKQQEIKERAGIVSGGNWIVDRVYAVDCLPGPGMLVNIGAEEVSMGGAPSNVLADLAKLGAPFPLAGVGVVGDDENGRLILDTYRNLGVDMSRVRVDPEAPTSVTHVMNDARSRERMFFHQRGANARFALDDIPFEELTCRLFHLGYLLLLDRMDSADAEYGTVAARVLCRLREQGIKTSLDVVSEESDRFKVLVPPALRHTDYLIINEIEAGRIVGRKTRQANGALDGAALVDAVEALYALGDMEVVAIHMAEGVYIRDRQGRRHSSGSLALPKGFIAGAVGAGDAFCAGMLYGLYEGWNYARTSFLASCCAAAALSKPGATDGLTKLENVLKFGEKYPEQEPPIRI